MSQYTKYYPFPVDGAADVPSLRTLGTGANQAAAGNDPRFNPSYTATNWDFYGQIDAPAWMSQLSPASLSLIQILYNRPFIDFDFRPDEGGLQNFGGGMFVPNYFGSPTITTVMPSTEGFGPDSYPRVRIVGGTAANQPAGMFGNANGAIFNRTQGYLVAARVARRTNENGTRGALLMLASAFGGTFQPSEAANSWGFTYDTTDAAPGNWYFHCRGENDTLQRIEITDAPRDDTTYEAFLLAEPGGGAMRAVLVRLGSTPDVVFDQAITGDLPDPDANCFSEINASPGLVSGPAQTLDIMRFWAKFGPA